MPLVEEIAAGYNHTLILTLNEMFSFGSNSAGQLGLGKNSPQYFKSPAVIKDLVNSEIRSIKAFDETSACLDSQGRLYVFGKGVWGMFPGANRVRGFGQGEKSVDEFGIGRGGMIWVVSSDGLYVWGSNKNQELPLTDKKDFKKPVLVEQLQGCSKIVSGSNFSCALL